MTYTIDDASLKMPPVGNPYFNEIIERNFYYVDKTNYIKKLFKEDTSKVFLICRPRRFGKSLLMDTCYKFLKINPENPADTSYQEKLFKHTQIIEDKEFCQNFMGRFPVISITLKDVDENTFDLARAKIASQIFTVANNLEYLLASPLFTNEEKEAFTLLKSFDKLSLGECQKNLSDSLKLLTAMLYRYYGRQVVVLIDEYDVPLAKAYVHGYYDEMVTLIKGMLSSTLKENPALFKGVLTGCLRVSKESIFTGFNNFDVNTVASDTGFLSESIGFTKDEVRTMLEYYSLTAYEGAVKEWYDGYKIAGREIFCPWDVICFCKKAVLERRNGDPISQPDSFWTDTSSSDVIYKYMPYLDVKEADRMQTLLDDGEIEFMLNEKLNYNEIGDLHYADDFWSLLLYTGYLTATKVTTIVRQGTFCRVRIPNEEVWLAFKDGIVDYYNSDSVKENSGKLLNALLNGDSIEAEDLLRDKLSVFVSVRDLQSKALPENFYHGFLNGIFSNLRLDADSFKSNAEAGNGFADIMYCSRKPRVGIILELKSTKDEDALIDTATVALAQIETKKYASVFARRHVQKVHCYGIAFCRKDCCVQYEIKQFSI